MKYNFNQKINKNPVAIGLHWIFLLIHYLCPRKKLKTHTSVSTKKNVPNNKIDNDNDTLIYLFLFIFNLLLSLFLDHHIISLQKIKINNLKVIRVMN